MTSPDNDDSRKNVKDCIQEAKDLDDNQGGQIDFRQSVTDCIQEMLINALDDNQVEGGQNDLLSVLRRASQKGNLGRKRKIKTGSKTSSSNFSRGLLNFSLLTANASQLRYVLSTPRHQYFEMLVGLISTSLVLQVLTMLFMIWTIVAKDYKVQGRNPFRWVVKESVKVAVLICVSFLTGVNIFISAFNNP